ncbi:hypothetical protein Tco_1015316, partial [Tanacetum coccineum]
SSKSPEQTPPSPVSALAYLEYLAPSEDEPIEDDFEEDHEMNPVDYADEEEEESSDDEEQEEGHLAPADSALLITTDYCPFFPDQTTRISVRPHTPPSPYAEARITEYAAAPIPLSPPPSPLSPLSSPLPLIPSPPLPLPSPPLLLPSPTYRDVIPEADMPPQKRTCFTAPSHRFEIGESFATDAPRHTGYAL